MEIKIELGEYYEEGEWYVTGITEDGGKFGGVGLSIMTADEAELATVAMTRDGTLHVRKIEEEK